jgi:cell division protein FtsW
MFFIKKNIKKNRRINIFLILLTLSLVGFGLVMIYNASSFEAYQVFGDKFYYVKNQIVWALLGLIVMLGLSRFSYRNFQHLTLPLLLINAVLLLIVLIPGIGIKILGARRWLNLGTFSFQPSELLKVTLTIYLADWFSQKRPAGPIFLIVFFLLALIVLQPDMGTALAILGMVVCVYFISGAPLKKILFFGLIVLLLAAMLIFSSSYRRNRIATFIDPSHDPLGKSYHVRQILIALGSGGLLGMGLGQSRQKYQYLPESTTDSIFAVIAEETGFLGGLILIAAFLFFCYLGFKVARRSANRFGLLLASGLTSWIGVQALINFGAMVSLLPLTGIPLPFVSYGGSSLLAAMASVGIIINISGD